MEAADNFIQDLDREFGSSDLISSMTTRFTNNCIVSSSFTADEKPRRGMEKRTKRPFCSYFGKDSGWVGDRTLDAGPGEYLTPVRIFPLPSIL
jgi:hypothetical protein